MKNETLLLIGAGVAAYFILDAATNNRASSQIGQGIGYSVGQTTGNTLVSTPVGFFQGLWDTGYNIGNTTYFLSPQYFKDIWANTYGRVF